MFSVVIPLYNKEKYIRETVQSVLAQDYKEFEVLIVNDGSTDGSLHKLKDISDARIKIINQENSGVSQARNTGISNASFEWIAFLDGDDVWSPNHLSELKRIIELFPSSGLISTQHSKFDRSSELVFKLKTHDSHIRSINYFAEAAKSPSIVWTSAACISQKVFNEIGGFSNIRIGEDLEYWVKVALDYPVAISDKVTSYYRQNTGGAMNTSGYREFCNFSSLSEINAPLSLLVEKAKNDPSIMESPNVIKYINSILKGDVRSSLYHNNFEMVKQFSKFAIPEKSASFIFLTLVNVTPIRITKTAVNAYKKIVKLN